VQGLSFNAKTTASRVLNRFRSVQSLQKRGAAVKYALLVGFIATVIVVAVGYFGQRLIPPFPNVLLGLR
jgi:Flp pilus assembly pilin Flp